MILWFAAAAAVGIQLAEPKGHPGSWMTDDDYPAQALRRRAQGQTRFRLLVSPDGKPVRCDVLVSSGHADLDQQTCALMIRRAEFSPARDSSGQPVYGTFTSMGLWRLPGEKFTLNKPASDLDLSVQALPKSVKRPAKVRVGLLIQPDGTVGDCKPSANDKNSAVLGPTACRQAAASIRMAPVHDLQNKPVVFVQGIEVTFSVVP